jgi:hypothetical protein
LQHEGAQTRLLDVLLNSTVNVVAIGAQNPHAQLLDSGGALLPVARVHCLSSEKKNEKTLT